MSRQTYLEQLVNLRTQAVLAVEARNNGDDEEMLNLLLTIIVIAKRIRKEFGL